MVPHSNWSGLGAALESISVTIAFLARVSVRSWDGVASGFISESPVCGFATLFGVYRVKSVQGEVLGEVKLRRVLRVEPHLSLKRVKPGCVAG